jgi:xanthine dehydrogenase molybdenum-binding subunit
MACGAHDTGTFPSVPEFSSAIVLLNEDGTANLLTGVADMGTGSSTVLAQIAAETLGVKFEDVTVVAADTDSTPIDRGVFASRGAYTGGLAAREAAKEARQRLLEEAAIRLGVEEQRLVAREGSITDRDNPRRTISIAEVAQSALARNGGQGPIIGKATVRVNANPNSCAAHFAEVEVNTQTGEIKVLKLLAVHDVGKAINPTIVEGQIEGALAMGMGYALTEELVIDEKGHVTNADFGNYKLMRADNMPQTEVVLIEMGEPSGPYGAKGVGEIGLVPTAPAILNAIWNATGTRFREIPVTRDRLLKDLNMKRNQTVSMFSH